ncbi:MAG: glycosyltransferase [Tepidiformaceae bacterium]
MHVIAMIAVGCGAGYLAWRAAFTLNPDALWLSIPLLIAEIHAYLTFCLFVFMAWDVRPVRPPAGEVRGRIGLFIPTFSEPYSVLALTIAGACEVRHPHETWVLDDGNREWVRELCERFGVRYVVRPDHASAKAGNLNHALAISNFDFVGIVDCDMVPSPAFFDDMLPYFADEKVAIVQGPQDFYNLTSFQHAGDDSSWHEQESFYKVIQRGKNRWNAAFWCGSPSIVRTSAIRDVGGVATETITEDLHTSLRIHRAGWKTVFHHGEAAKGLAPDDYDGFILQRLRWANGSMQVIRREWRRRGLTLAQRLNYMASTGTYFDAYRKLIMLLIPPAILFADQLPVRAPGLVFFVAWAVQFASITAANKALGRGYHRFWRTEMFDLMKLFAFVSAGLALAIERSVHFRVTPKGEAGRKHVHPFIVPYLALLGLYVQGIVVGGLRLNGGLWQTRNALATVAAMSWSAAIMVVVGAIVWRSYRHITRRRAYRFPANESILCRDAYSVSPAILRDLTVDGVRFRSEQMIEPGESVSVRAREEGAQWVAATVLSCEPEDGGWVVRAVIGESIEARDELARLIAGRLFPLQSSDEASQLDSAGILRAA